jgi:hypothetical protein
MRVFSNYKDNCFYGFPPEFTPYPIRGGNDVLVKLDSSFLFVIVGLDPTIQTLLNNLSYNI